MRRDLDSWFLWPEEEKCNLVDVFSYLMSEDRAAYRENRVGLNSQLHSKKKPYRQWM